MLNAGTLGDVETAINKNDVRKVSNVRRTIIC